MCSAYGQHMLRDRLAAITAAVVAADFLYRGWRYAEELRHRRDFRSHSVRP